MPECNAKEWGWGLEPGKIITEVERLFVVNFQVKVISHRMSNCEMMLTTCCQYIFIWNTRFSSQIQLLLIDWINSIQLILFKKTSVLSLTYFTVHFVEDLSFFSFMFLRRCVWNNEDCSADDFEEVLTDHGVCYSFNSGKNRSVLDVAYTGRPGLTSLFLSQHLQFLNICRKRSF